MSQSEKERNRVNTQRWWKKLNSDSVRKEKNLAYHRQADAKRYAKAKDLVFEHYGSSCACCGEINKKFLTIDHINNDGAEHRRKIRGQFKALPYWLVRNGFPDGFQILCHNCNVGKWRNKGICPHKETTAFADRAFVSEGRL